MIIMIFRKKLGVYRNMNNTVIIFKLFLHQDSKLSSFLALFVHNVAKWFLTIHLRFHGLFIY